MKIIITIILIILGIHFGIWIFNHINAWLGIALILLTLGISIKQSIKYYKQLN